MSLHDKPMVEGALLDLGKRYLYHGWILKLNREGLELNFEVQKKNRFRDH